MAEEVKSASYVFPYLYDETQETASTYGAARRPSSHRARSGITTVVEPQNGLDDLELFVRAREDGTLRSRLVAAIYCEPGTTTERLDYIEEARRTYDDDTFRVSPIKLYIDDVIEPHTAAMLEPYANRPDDQGNTFWETSEFEAFLLELERRNFQAFTHATGDRGIRTVLDAVQRCREVNGPRDARHQIVHVECVHPDDLVRFAELGVVACMQPRHCAPDIVAEWRENVGILTSSTSLTMSGMTLLYPDLPPGTPRGAGSPASSGSGA